MVLAKGREAIEVVEAARPPIGQVGEEIESRK